MLSSEISIALELHGISHVVSTGCTSSTDAISYAASLIRCRRGGGPVERRRRRLRHARDDFRLLEDARGVDRATTSSPPPRRGRSTRGRDGFVLGEGAWMVVLEREDRARARGATVYATIDGYGSTCDAYHRVQMDPDGEQIVRAMALAIERSGRADRGDRLRQLPRHVDGAQRRGRVPLRAPAVRRPRRSRRRLLDQVDDRPSAGRQRRRRASSPPRWRCRATSCRRPSTRTPPDPACDLDFIPNQRPRRAGRGGAVQLPGVRLEEQRDGRWEGHGL